jgi:hypothetical protein
MGLGFKLLKMVVLSLVFMRWLSVVSVIGVLLRLVLVIKSGCEMLCCL